nr:CMP-N-acetylneuraminate-beta-1,4-galactoside alpha-2,3-sialyltransferase isoform X7 [Macaca fascicularis]
MGLLVFVRNLLLALCLFLVLGFLYYSAWKLHLLQWEEDSSKYSHSSSSQEKPVSDSVVLSFDSAGQALGSEYDRLGFLLNLDSKLFSKPAPMFLDDSFRKWARIREFVPPFGIKGQDNLIKAILSVTKEYRLTPALDSLRCRRCIIVGNGGVLANKSLGSRIDDYDIVVRLNSAPVKGFEKDVGSKTTLRITYPEGAMQRPEQYERDSLFVLAGFKWQDFKWLKYIVYKERVVHSRTVDGESQERQQQGKWEHRRADRREGRLLPVPQLLQIGSQGSCAAGSSHWPRSPLRPQQHTHSIPRPVPAPQAPSYPPLLHTGAPPHTLFTIIPLVPVTHPISPNTDGLPTPQALGSPLNALCSRLTVPTWGSLPLP